MVLFYFIFVHVQGNVMLFLSVINFTVDDMLRMGVGVGVGVGGEQTFIWNSMNGIERGVDGE